MRIRLSDDNDKSMGAVETVDDDGNVTARWSYGQIAGSTSYSRSMVSRVFTGRRNPSIAMARAIAGVLGTTLDVVNDFLLDKRG